MKRRNFLGLLGGAAVAGPSMAKQAAANGIESLGVPAIPFSPGVPVGGLASAGPISQGGWDPLHEARADLARLLGMTAAERLRLKRLQQVTTLDPDIAAMRSFSLDAKIRIQRERNVERQLENERGWIERRIHDLTTT